MPTMTVGVLAAHDDAKQLAGRLTAELPAALGRRYENVEWHVRQAEADPADPAADERQLVEATRRRALDEGWQLAIGLTDLPLSVRRRPVRAHVSAQHGVGLVSVPALGAVRREARLEDIALSRIERLLGDGDRARLHAARVDETTARSAGTFEFTGLALGTAALALTSQNIWTLADHMSVLRLVALLLISVALTTVALIAAHGLWERTSDPGARERVVLFNLSTAVTLALGTACSTWRCSSSPCSAPRPALPGGHRGERRPRGRRRRLPPARLARRDDRDGRRRPRLPHRLRHGDPQRRLPPAPRRGPRRGRVTSPRGRR